MWIESWWGLLRVLVAGLVTYAFLILLLRSSGKRTLSKLNAFDLVVTIAMGSTLSAVVVTKDIPVAEGLEALLLLVACQYLVARVSIRVAPFARLVRSEPRLLLRDGVVLEDALREERVTRGELLAALRQHGIGAVSEVKAVVLETDGSFSVLRDVPQQGESTLDDAKR